MEENSFAQRLKNLLEEKQLTLTQVANAIGKSPPSVHRWTRGGEIDYANLRALANYLGVSWIWLRYGDEALQDLQSDPAASEAMTEQRRKYLGEIMENEARMHLAQEMANIVTWELNILTDDVTASPNAEKVFGQPLQELNDFWAIFHDKDLDELARLFASPGKTYEWDYHAEDGSDNDRWFTSRGLLLTDAHQRPIKIIGVSIDMTERKRMETALQRSEYTLRKVIETIPVGLWIADKNGKIVTANPEVQRIWGGAKYVGLDEYGEYKGWWEATGKKIENFEWTLARAILRGESSTREVVNIEAFDGSKKTILMSAIPLLDTQQQIIGAIEVNQDITELKQVEMTLRENDLQLRAVFDQFPIGIAYAESDGTLLQANRKLCHLLGYAGEALIGKNIRDLICSADVEQIDGHIRKLLASEIKIIKINSCLRCKNGRSLSAEIAVSLIRNVQSVGSVHLIVTVEAINEISENQQPGHHNAKVSRISR